MSRTFRNRPEITGDETPVMIHGQPLYETEFSDGLLMFLLKGVNPEKFKDRSEVQTVWDGDVTKLSDAQLSKITDHLLSLACGNDPVRIEEARKQLEATVGQVVDITAEVQVTDQQSA